MNSKIKGKDLKLGDELYLVSEHNLSAGVEKVIVTALVLDKGEIKFHLDNDKYYFTSWWNTFLTRSEKKANKVLQILIDANERIKIRYKQRDDIYSANNLKLTEVKSNYVGKTVMVRFKRQNNESNYEKVVISDVFPTHKLNVYLFSTRPRTNHYLTSREGKNWYFWTELDELKQKKQEIDRRILELEKESLK